ncbi:MAG: pflA [Bacteroidetes bacterium]|nr:pflA [Bacteroidota bacterium]
MSSGETMSLRETLTRLSRPGELYERAEKSWVTCVACGHRCRIAPDREGICKVRFNLDGTLMVPYGYVAGLQIDPIEKKPFFHALPGASALSFGMLGCDYHCGYCQNWYTSQALRDPAAGTQPEAVSPEYIVELAVQRRVPVLTSTYNEPLITSEWAVAVFRLARQHGILCSYVSNGNGTPEVLAYLKPYIDFYKVDLKSFRQKNYQQLGGKLDNVLSTIAQLRALGIWVEVVTLVVPGFNDSPEELRDIAGFLTSVSPDIPWHVTAFHQDYRMVDPPRTTAAGLSRAAEIGYSAGLHFVYAGNLPGRTQSLEDTRCPGCDTTLIERVGFTVKANHMQNGHCPKCARSIPGVWQAKSPAF